MAARGARRPPKLAGCNNCRRGEREQLGPQTMSTDPAVRRRRARRMRRSVHDLSDLDRRRCAAGRSPASATPRAPAAPRRPSAAGASRRSARPRPRPRGSFAGRQSRKMLLPAAGRWRCRLLGFRWSARAAAVPAAPTLQARNHPPRRLRCRSRRPPRRGRRRAGRRTPSLSIRRGAAEWRLCRPRAPSPRPRRCSRRRRGTRGGTEAAARGCRRAALRAACSQRWSRTCCGSWATAWRPSRTSAASASLRWPSSAGFRHRRLVAGGPSATPSPAHRSAPRQPPRR
mmetsp:Transcript_85003/g.245485  ORF Transcript_85003/g.245485 Transcript_85003/m.245485 type:complete len:286 (-) Transcript_85003:787-1644(-)